MALTRKIEKPTFDKVAAPRGILSGNPTLYGPELQNQLYSQHAFLSDYAVQVQIHNQDDMAGYLYGLFVVRPNNMEPGPDAPTARIPIIVTGKKVHPFDVFITKEGEFLPLTQSRLTTSLFNSVPYKAVSQQSVNQQYGDATASSIGFDASPLSSGDRTNVFNKQSSVLLDVLASSSQDAKDAFIRRVAESPTLRAAFEEHPAFARAVQAVAQTPTELVEKTASYERLAPVAAVLVKEASGFVVRSLYPASQLTYTGEDLHLSRAQAAEIPTELRQEALRYGAAAIPMNDNAALAELSSHTSQDLKKVASATTNFGIYHSMSFDNAPCKLGVFTKVAALDGRMINHSALVIGPDGARLQEHPAGIPTGDKFDPSIVKSAEPHGLGFFIFGDTVTEPVTVRASVIDQDGANYYVDDQIGQRYTVKLAAVQKLAQAGKKAVLLPEDAKFIPIKEAKHPYITEPTKLARYSAIPEQMHGVTIRHWENGITVSDTDGNVLHKSAGYADALAYLLAIGDSPDGAKEKIAALHSFKKNEYNVVPMRWNMPKVKTASAKYFDVSAIRIDLTKEAAVLAAPDAVDTVLSLNFATPENADKFVEHLPEFEACVSRLAELLVGVRIGLPDIPEAAILGAMTGLDKSIQGLKKLQIRLSLPTEEDEAA